MANGHAKRNPSSAHRWIPCPGSVRKEAPFPDDTNEYMAEGTVAHDIAAKALENGHKASQYIGQVFSQDGYTFLVDDTMAGYVQQYIDQVMAYFEAAGPGAEYLVETAVPIGHITGEKGAQGTADFLILDYANGEIQAHDLKYGQGVVVDAERNEQAMLYAAGAWEEFDFLADFDFFTHVIHQPRVNHLSEWSCDRGEMEAFVKEAEVAAIRGAEADAFDGSQAEFDAQYVFPGEKQCRFCKAKAQCEPLAAMVQEATGALFEDERPPEATKAGEPVTDDTTYLAQKMTLVPLIEGWCKAVRAEVERRMFDGDDVPGYKLVQGRRGQRKWTDPDAVEEMLRRHWRLPKAQVYEQSLISPAQADKLKLGRKRRAELQDFVTQSDGNVSVAPVSDKRPAVDPSGSAADFDDER